MAKPKPPKKTLDTFTVKGTHKVVRDLLCKTLQRPRRILGTVKGTHKVVRDLLCKTLKRSRRILGTVKGTHKVVRDLLCKTLKRSRRILGTVKGTHKVVRVGESVLMRPQDPDKHPYVAKVEAIESDNKGNVKVRVRWYYRPEESLGGRRQFHGAKELFLSDHCDVQSADTIEGKCTVHTFKSYTKLESVADDDYFCRFEYKAATGTFTPDRVAVYCKCEMPYNPDDLMVQCEACKDWFHPACMNLTTEQVKKLEQFTCLDCGAQDGDEKVHNSYKDSPPSESKPEPKRRKK